MTELRNRLPSERGALYGKYASDTVLVAATRVALALRGLVLLAVLSKTLDAEHYGIWAQIQVTVSLLMLVGFLHIDTAMMRFLSAENGRKAVGRAFFSILVAVGSVSALLSVLVFFAAGPLADTFFGTDAAGPFIRLAAASVFLTTMDEAVLAYFVSLRQTSRYALFLLTLLTAELVLVGGLVAAGNGLNGAIMAQLVARAGVFVVGAAFIGRQTGLALPRFSTLRPYLTFSLPLVPAGLCFWAINVSDRYVIGYFMGAADVGFYSAAYTLGNIIAFFFAPFSVLLLPAMSRLYEGSRMPEIKTYLEYSLRFFLMLAIPAVFGLSILARNLLTVITTAEFAEANLVVLLTSIAALLYHCGAFGENVQLLFKKTRFIAGVFFGIAALNLVGNIILVPLMGIAGAAVSTLITFAVYAVVMGASGLRRVPFNLNPRFIIKSLLASAAVGTLVLWMNPAGVIHLVLTIAAGAAVYFGALVLLRGFTLQEYSFLKSMLRRA